MHLRNAPKVGKYFVNVKSFESIALPALKVFGNYLFYHSYFLTVKIIKDTSG